VLFSLSWNHRTGFGCFSNEQFSSLFYKQSLNLFLVFLRCALQKEHWPSLFLLFLLQLLCRPKSKLLNNFSFLFKWLASSTACQTYFEPSKYVGSWRIVILDQGSSILALQEIFLWNIFYSLCILLVLQILKLWLFVITYLPELLLLLFSHFYYIGHSNSYTLFCFIF
jgi:hypothetical protein